MRSTLDGGPESGDGQKCPLKFTNLSGINLGEPQEDVRFTFHRTPNMIADPFCSVAFRRTRSVIPSWDNSVPPNSSTVNHGKKENSGTTAESKHPRGAGAGYWINNNPSTKPWNDSRSIMSSDTMYRTEFRDKNLIWRELVGIS